MPFKDTPSERFGKYTHGTWQLAPGIPDYTVKRGCGLCVSVASPSLFCNGPRGNTCPSFSCCLHASKKHVMSIPRWEEGVSEPV